MIKNLEMRRWSSIIQVGLMQSEEEGRRTKVKRKKKEDLIRKTEVRVI